MAPEEETGASYSTVIGGAIASAALAEARAATTGINTNKERVRQKSENFSKAPDRNEIIGLSIAEAAVAQAKEIQRVEQSNRDHATYNTVIGGAIATAAIEEARAATTGINTITERVRMISTNALKAPDRKEIIGLSITEAAIAQAKEIQCVEQVNRDDLRYASTSAIN